MDQPQLTEIELRLELVGKPLKNWREAVGLSQSVVAKQLNYSGPQFVSNWERGIALPPMDVLPKLIVLYRISPDELLEIMSKYQEQLHGLQQAQLTELLLGKKRPQ